MQSCWLKTMRMWMRKAITSANHFICLEYMVNESRLYLSSRLRAEFTCCTYSNLGHANIAKLLIETGAGVNARDESGESPLHLTAIHGKLETVLEHRKFRIWAKKIDCFLYWNSNIKDMITLQSCWLIIMQMLMQVILMESQHCIYQP